MKEIKYRARHVATGKWWYGDTARKHESPLPIMRLSEFWSYIYADVLSILTIGEYIGLKDKNGVEGYSDDIVRWGKALYQVVWNDIDGITQLYYISGREVFKTLRITQIRKGLIIGNIWDNPELKETR